jgi:hypothetical protein
LNDYQIPKKRHVFVLISLAGTLWQVQILGR